MTMIGLNEHEQQRPSHLYGDSSAKAFTDHIKIMIGVRAPPSRLQKFDRERPRPDQGPLTRNFPLQDYVLPSRQRADHLLNSYWQRAVYPFVEAEEVDPFYQQLWTGEHLGEDGSTFLCLINMIFSMSSIMGPASTPGERAKSADVFYQRAREFIDLNFLQRPSVLAVQCFLLLCEYLQSKSDPQGCWTFIGLGIRIAQSLGLDLPATSAGAATTRDQEKLRRVWHSCILMDRSLAMTLGRSEMITAHAAASVPYPAAHPNSLACSCFHDTAADVPQASYHFFIEALKLYEVMKEVRLSLYSPIPEGVPQDDAFSLYFGGLGATTAGTIMVMETKLWKLGNGLPPYLRYDPNSPKTNTTHQRQTNILWLRHRHIRLLLFRPVLAKFCRPPEATDSATGSNLSWKIALQYSVTCVETALETIRFLDATISIHEECQLEALLPGWWYGIFFIYSAATVLVAARLQPDIIAQVTEKAIMDGWKSVLKALHRFSSFSNYAARCAAMLNLLFEQVLHKGLTSQPSSPSSQDQIHHPVPQTEDLRHHDGNDNNDDHYGPPYDILSPSRSHISNQPPANVYNAGASTSLLLPQQPQTDLTSTYDWALSQPYADTVENITFSDYFPAVGSLDPSDIQFELNGMSWLTNMPWQLGGSTPV
jgi:hypothetical protein